MKSKTDIEWYMILYFSRDKNASFPHKPKPFKKIPVKVAFAGQLCYTDSIQ